MVPANFRDVALQVNVDPELIDQPPQSARDVVHPAVHIPKVMPELDRRDRIEKGWRAVSRRADVLDEVIEDVLEVSGSKMRCDRAMHRPEQIELQKFALPVVPAESAP